MNKRPLRDGARWTPKEEKQLKTLAKQNTPTRLMGFKLQRTEASIRNKAQSLNLSLKPTNKSPYG
jgi:hypothetical protein